MTQSIDCINKDQILQEINHLVHDEMEAVNQFILQELSSHVPLIETVSQHLIANGGKRLRPIIVLLVAKALKYSVDQEHIELAAIIEFIHTATLLHDDVVDNSSQRRYQKTANAIWGNSISVLSGDFLYSRAFQILARRSNIPIMKLLAHTTNQLAEGEVLQLLHLQEPHLSKEHYYDIIRRKTAELYSASAQIGGLIAHATPTQQNALTEFGLSLGMAFQITDDLLDYTAEGALGKNLGDDLAEGKITLPIIYAIEFATASQKSQIEKMIQECNPENIQPISAILEETSAFAHTLEAAQQFANVAIQALRLLPSNSYRQALEDITHFVIARAQKSSIKMTEGALPDSV